MPNKIGNAYRASQHELYNIVADLWADTERITYPSHRGYTVGFGEYMAHRIKDALGIECKEPLTTQCDIDAVFGPEENE